MLKLSKFYVKLQLVSDNTGPGYLFTQPDKVAEFGRQKIGDSDKENFMVFCLDARNRVVAYEITSIGSSSASLVHPREVFKTAILSNSNAIILMHNHPSGVLDPSQDDLLITKRLVEAGRILGIEILDHIIVSQTDEFSFKFKGLI